MEQNRPPIFLYTDGAASGNPGPGGYGVVLACAGRRKEMSAGYRLTTNNRMELLAVIKGLERTGFAKKKNVDLWLRFDAVYRRHRVSFNWLKGHAGHPENERCDALAVAAYQSGENLLEDTGYITENQGLNI